MWDVFFNHITQKKKKMGEGGITYLRAYVICHHVLLL